MLYPFSNLKPAPPISLVILLTGRVACPVSAPDTGPSILAPCPPFPPAPVAPSLPGAFPGGSADGRRRRPRPAAGRPPVVARPGPPGAGQRPPGQRPPALDARLPGGGWPASGLCEVLQAAPGVGELALVWPALARLSQRDRPIVLVAPPSPACPGLGCGRAGPGPAAGHPRCAEAGAVGGRTMPALCRLRGGAVLATPGRRPCPAPAAGGRRQRPVPGLRVPRGTGGAQSLPGQPAPAARPRPGTGAEVPWRPATRAAVATGHRPLRPRHALGLRVVAALALDSVLRLQPDPQRPLVLLQGPAQRRVLRAVSPARAQQGCAGHAAVGRAGAGAGHAPARLRSQRRTAHPPAAGQLGLRPVRRSASISRTRWSWRSVPAAPCSVTG